MIRPASPREDAVADAADLAGRRTGSGRRGRGSRRPRGPLTRILPSVETSITPTAFCTCFASAAGSGPYECGRFHAPVHIDVAPSSSWRWWSAVRFTGSCGRPGQEAERHRRVRRPSGRRPDRGLVEPRRLRVARGSSSLAQPPLARPHRHGRVPLGELDRVEPLVDRVLQVLRRLVLAEADEALARPVPSDGRRDGRRRRRRRTPAPTASTPGGSSVGTKTPRALVVLDPAPACARSL